MAGARYAKGGQILITNPLLCLHMCKKYINSNDVHIAVFKICEIHGEKYMHTIVYWGFFPAFNYLKSIR